jgi:hypothetical protein
MGNSAIMQGASDGVEEALNDQKESERSETRSVGRPQESDTREPAVCHQPPKFPRAHPQVGRCFPRAQEAAAGLTAVRPRRVRCVLRLNHGCSENSVALSGDFLFWLAQIASIIALAASSVGLLRRASPACDVPRWTVFGSAPYRPS